MNNQAPILQRIVDNIEKYDFARYDPTDLKELKISRKLFKKLVLVFGQISPLYFRKILNIKQRIFSTTYTHVGEAYILIELLNIDVEKKASSLDITDLIINEYYDSISRCWPYRINTSWNVCLEYNNTPPSMPMHGLARINILLLKIGMKYDIQNYIDIAVNTAASTIINNNLRRYPDGSLSISYYYNSNDCTLNVNTEFAQWLAMIPNHRQTPKNIEIVNGIVQLLIKEQNSDGSWFYFSKEHHQRCGVATIIDCHHTGTVLTNLINVIGSNVLTELNQNNLITSISKGVKYYLKTFFDADGHGITEVGLRRPAGPVQYSEAIIAFCEYIQCEQCVNLSLKKEIALILPKIVLQVQKLIDRNGAVPSEKILKWNRLNSIRWGNGPVLQSLLFYISCEESIKKYQDCE